MGQKLSTQFREGIQRISDSPVLATRSVEEGSTGISDPKGDGEVFSWGGTSQPKDPDQLPPTTSYSDHEGVRATPATVPAGPNLARSELLHTAF